jgi:hypothetical protein
MQFGVRLIAKIVFCGWLVTPGSMKIFEGGVVKESVNTSHVMVTMKFLVIPVTAGKLASLTTN